MYDMRLRYKYINKMSIFPGWKNKLPMLIKDVKNIGRPK